ncbi:MAG TPA: methicillin resistance protein [Clostridiaceae bacterium]|jgi:ribosomal protein S18 acetylase RimI-like enzyme|nr:methicillin resistance protein [Clostridiaceae bacterium]HBF77139.1 methicillin resistance protein [Clostridiaceae bacterium]HBG38101.1 methicillin resistance protein [Clostridiaceae bacterium]HBN28068.1 methicillin resistance protein [Clostridiaceae bacterium]HBX48768.1 methicillin resistance protein [Clostridiaceae bacterium]
MSYKDKYRELCKNEKSIPLFSKDWWMDAVCGEENWDVFVVERGGQIAAAMPYYIKKKFGIKYITQPKLTQTNGIWIRYHENQRYERKLAYENEVMTEIINQLGEINVAYFQQNFHYSITNYLPFYLRGFEQNTRYTYVIEDLTDLEYVFSNFSKNHKKIIRNNLEKVRIYETEDIKQFYSLNKMVFQRQGLPIPYSFELVSKLDNACKQKNIRVMLAAEDENGIIHSVLYITWDEQSAYFIMSGADPKFRNCNFETSLTWEGIKYASNVSKKLNFDGSMIENISDFFRKFGAVQKPYFNISKAFKYKLPIDIYKKIR